MKYEIILLMQKDAVLWDGNDGDDACKKFALAHPGIAVMGYRTPGSKPKEVPMNPPKQTPGFRPDAMVGG
mgnify:CR=1 FL=1